MRDIFKNYEEEKINKKKRRRAVKAVTAIGALAVAGVVMWQMILPGIAMQNTPHCGKEEHTHTDACYTNQLTCGKEETDGHQHTDACYKTERVLSCGQEESATHQHTDACYTEQKVLVCGQQEKAAHHHSSACYTKQLTCGKEEHTHTDACYSDPTADVEYEDTWKRTFANVKLGDDWGDNVAAIAKTQVGYHESEKNYNVVENNEHKGYTRYGNWAGGTNIYGNWDTTFAEFCIHYAQIPDTAFPMNADIDQWIKSLQDNDLYVDKNSENYQAGDLIFFQKKNQETEKQIGIIEKVEEKNGKTYISVIEGNCENQVKRNEYTSDDENILGYGLICKAQMKYKAAQMTQDEANARATTDADTQQEAQVQTADNTQAVFYNDDVNGESQTQSTETGNSELIPITDAKVKLETKATESETANGYSRDKQFEFSLSYKIANQITETNNKAYYDLLDELTDIASAAYSQTGTIWDGDIAVGNYQIVKVKDENGKEHSRVIFEYTNKDWIEQNGSNVTGTFNFYGKISKTASDNKDEVKIKYDGNSEPIEIKFEDGKVTGRKDHKINADGTIDCTITFDVKGKDATVNLKDTLGDNLEFVSGSFKLDNNAISDLKSGEETKFENLSIGTHTITYKVKVTDINNTDATHNKIEWSWGEKNKYKDEYDDKITFQKEGITKTGSYDPTTGKIVWIITVTPSQFKSVKGTTINDILTSKNHKYDGEAIICTNPWWVDGTTIDKITLDPDSDSFSYTFDKKTDEEYGIGQTYYIKYSTVPTDLPKEGDGTTEHIYTNKVNDKEYSDTIKESGNGGNSGDDGKDTIDIVKKDGTILPNQKLQWRITVDPDKYKGNNKELTSLILEDVLEKSDCYNANSNYDADSFKFYDEEGKELNYINGTDYILTLSKPDQYSNASFRMEFINIPQKKFSIVYTTTALNAGSWQTNTVKSTYTIDGKSNQESDSSNQQYQKDGMPMSKNGTINGKVIDWTIVVDATSSQHEFMEGGLKEAGKYTITDILPDGLTYIDGSADYEIEHFGGTIEKGEITPTQTEDRKMSFDVNIHYDLIDQGKNAARVKITLHFKTAINTPLPTENGNGLTVTENGIKYHNDTNFNKDGTIYANASADAEIKNKYLTKAGTVGKNNVINYKLVVNYNAEDLIPNNNYIDLVVSDE